MPKYAVLLEQPPVTSLKINRPRREFDDMYGPFDSHGWAWTQSRQKASESGNSRDLLLATTLANALHASDSPNYDTPPLTHAEELRLIGLMGISRFLLFIAHDEDYGEISGELGFDHKEMRLDMEADPARGLHVGSVVQDGLEITFADTGSIPRHPSLHYAAKKDAVVAGDPRDQWSKYAGGLYLRRQVETDASLLPVTITPYYPSGNLSELRPTDPVPYPLG